MAVFPPVDDALPEPKGSKNLKEALDQLEQVTDKLLDEVRGELPLHDTLSDIVDRMR